MFTLVCDAKQGGFCLETGLAYCSVKWMQGLQNALAAVRDWSLWVPAFLGMLVLARILAD